MVPGRSGDSRPESKKSAERDGLVVGDDALACRSAGVGAAAATTSRDQRSDLGLFWCLDLHPASSQDQPSFLSPRLFTYSSLHLPEAVQIPINHKMDPAS
jgi:hypothetical protein